MLIMSGKTTMTIVSTESREQFLKQLTSSIEQKLNRDESEAVRAFAREYFCNYPLDELEGHEITDVYGSTYWWWSFIKSREAGKRKIAVFNPNLDEQGWLSQHTVICLLQSEAPFLLDSIRLELERQDITVHTVHNTSMAVLRDQFGELIDFAAADKPMQTTDSQQKSIESLLYFEIAFHSDVEEQKQIATALEEVLSHATLVVDDFGAMKAKVEQIVQELRSIHADSLRAEIDESIEFLNWLMDDHFTFLGYSEYYFSNSSNNINGETQAELSLKEIAEARLGLMRLRGGGNREWIVDPNSSEEGRFAAVPHVLGFSKSSFRPRIHRSAYSDYIIIKSYDRDGKHIGEYRFMGFYTVNVYHMSPIRIPVLRKKIQSVLARSGFRENSLDYKSLLQVLHTFPRDELFQSNVSNLAETTINVMRIKEHRQVRFFARRDRFGKFITCLIYMPRDIYNTELRSKVQDFLAEKFNAKSSEFTTFFSESVLARTYMNFRVDADDVPEFDTKYLERKIVEITRSWDSVLLDALIENLGEELGTETARLYSKTFPAAYREDFDARYAVNDIQRINGLSEDGDLAMSFYRPLTAACNVMRFKVYRLNEDLALSDIIPVLENMGLRVLGESPYELHRADGVVIWIHDFHLRHNDAEHIDLDKVKDNFSRAFINIWQGHAESDGFNRLIIGSNLSWREVSLLRAYSSYMKQINFNFSKEAIVETLVKYADITKDIIRLFKASFDPASNPDCQYNEAKCAQIEGSIIEALDDVANLNQDTIIRRIVDLIRATLRTNYFQQDHQRQPKPYLATKFDPNAIPEMPLPIPKYEIYVYSPRVEGVHLRGGEVARGGLRWSDRKEDFRTEILGLVKAQQVKNAVIVPVGAKGGFVAKQLPRGGDRDEIQQEGIACYRLFIQALLDLTDNLVNGEVVPPAAVVRKDGNDTYLVVAADKGTATFSDIANELSEQHGFWLGDAFASGGSTGYDHKKMGITAKGAWVSVQRHFRERDHNVQEQNFSVIAIGDMAGDVFGNGMLCSEHIELVAAFNHMHIFIDPNPDAEQTFTERKRLFELPRSSWTDFNSELISEGGGVFLRSAKSIVITPQMAERFAINAAKLTPNELISAILKAPVDLIWNGGIGTYIKSKAESHSDVGDKANDVLRVNGEDLKCRVIGEGGNLGVTQLGRTEFGLNGGALDTDFIDNAGGVDCSDHEVNIKILLNEVVESGDLTIKQRNELLESMTDEVSDLVLKNNYRQVQTISLAERQGVVRLGEYRRYISALEAAGKLNRALEFLPDDDQLVERKVAGKGLSRPELSVLLSYSKVILKEDLAHSTIAEDIYIARAVETAFPTRLRETYANQIHQHRLKKEIIATQVANDLVNRMGFSFVYRLVDSTGAPPCKVAQAYVAVRDIFGIEEIWQSIEDLDYKISAQVQLDLMSQLMRLVRRGTRWFLRNHRGEFNVEAEVARYTPAVKVISDSLSELLQGELCSEWQTKYNDMIDSGVPEELARKLAGAASLYASLGVADVAQHQEHLVNYVATIYFTLGNVLELHWFTNQIADIKVDNHWHALARENLMDDVDAQQRSLAASLLLSLGREQFTQDKDVEEGIQRWLVQHETLVTRWRSMMMELRGSNVSDFAIYSVAIRDLLDLAQSSEYQG